MNMTRIGIAAIGMALVMGAAACTLPPPTATPPSSHDPTVVESPVNLWDKNGDGLLTVGFAQSGSESKWRMLNSESFKSFFVSTNGFQLVFRDADGDDAQQKADVLDFITQGVEVIIITPVTPKAGNRSCKRSRPQEYRSSTLIGNLRDWNSTTSSTSAIACEEKPTIWWNGSRTMSTTIA